MEEMTRAGLTIFRALGNKAQGPPPSAKQSQSRYHQDHIALYYQASAWLSGDVCVYNSLSIKCMHSKDKTDAQLCITFYNESFTELGGLMSTY